MDKTNDTKLNRQTTPIDPDQDPIVEILRLAYRRGLAIRREQAKQAKSTEENECTPGCLRTAE
jgi:hypothetical protein